MAGANLSEAVSTPEAYVVPPVGEKRFTVAAVDLGIKANTPRMMSERGIEVHVLPATSTIEDVLAVGPDGLFFSNGPGDPAATTAQVELLQGALARGIPYFGICFGNQLFGRALGFGTYKLKYGHRGINQPVMDRTTGKVEVTAHNHGFAVDAPLEGSTRPSSAITVSHVCLNDDVVEGLELPRRRRRAHELLGAVPPRGGRRSARCGVPLRPVQRSHVSRHARRARCNNQRVVPANGEGRPDMPKRTDIQSVLVIGSGPIIIGQACEFDYSGTQACRVLMAEGMRVVLVNSNPATIMTDPEFADATYIEPITPEYVEKVIAKERPDALLATLGGQTALNCAMALDKAGVLEKYGVELIGAPSRRSSAGRTARVQEDRRPSSAARAPAASSATPMDDLLAARRRARLPDGGPPVLHDGRHRLRHGLRRGRPEPHRRRRPRA